MAGLEREAVHVARGARRIGGVRAMAYHGFCHAHHPCRSASLMPRIPLHMVLARNIAVGLGTDLLDPASGHYLLGATTPDIRVLTKQDRLSTHYFDLNVMEHQDSVAGFLADHGRLAAPEKLNPETRAFVTGYITHLVLDEQYITSVYRPYFAHHDELGGSIRANAMDRLLQADLDRVYGAGDDLQHKLTVALACTVDGIDAGFVDSETLERWRQIAADVWSHAMDWDRMRGMIANHLRLGGLAEGETLSSFLDSLPELLNETIAHITSAEIDAFIQRSTDAGRRAVERYLACG
jgi:hypothetical protein